VAAGLLAKALGADRVIGVNRGGERCALAKEMGAVDDAICEEGEADAVVEGVMELTRGRGVEVAVDCSGNAAAREAALRSTRGEGRVVLVGEGGRLDLDVSEWLIHPQRRLLGSWVTSVPRMEDLLEHLVRWDLHPERTVTARFPLAEAGRAYATAAAGDSGKVAVVMD
jgi:threonine dehydrogenase-like Zn-dependent dehydrogenase